MADEKELACVWYGMNIEMSIDRIIDDARRLEGFTDITSGYYKLWDNVQDSMNELKRTINNAQRICGLNPDVASKTVNGRSVAENMNMLQESIERKNTNAVHEMAVHLGTSITVQSSESSGRVLSRLESARHIEKIRMS